METGFLDRLANQLKANKTATCRRAIQRILVHIKEKHCESGQYQSATDAESEFRRLVESDLACKQSVDSLQERLSRLSNKEASLPDTANQRLCKWKPSRRGDSSVLCHRLVALVSEGKRTRLFPNAIG